MATYSTVTPAQKAAIDTFMTVLRPLMGQFAKVLNQSAVLDQAWNGGVKALVMGLDAGSIVSDPTGLAGAQPLPIEQIEAAMTALESALATYNTPAMQQAFIGAAGLTNTIL